MKILVTLLLLLVLFAAPTGIDGSQQEAPEPGGESSPGATAAPEEQLEEFVPSEEISADKAISFPTDI
jgi:hypothetical protein